MLAADVFASYLSSRAVIIDVMELPNWRESSSGARIRAALWLATEVGEGGKFTKSELRAAFPDYEQIDRRVRDLRPEGWEIATYREDRSLLQDELRLVAIGGAVWESNYRSKATMAISDRRRREVFLADGYSCVYCGVTAGEEYADDPLKTARLLVGRIRSTAGAAPELVTTCARCHSALANGEVDADAIAAMKALNGCERDEFRSWVRIGTRPRSKLERLWGRYKTLPEESRSEIETQLGADSIDP
jgi:hypothetical protein